MNSSEPLWWQRFFARSVCPLMLLLLLLAARQASATDGPVRIDLTATSDGQFRVQLSNVGHSALEVLRWSTPFEAELSQDVFQVEHPLTGQRSLYRGRLAKRADAGADQLIQLAPGESISELVNLARYYALASAGSYLVRYEGQLLYRDTDSARVSDSIDQFKRVAISSDAIMLALIPAPETRAALASSFSDSCSAGQRAAINAAVDASEQITITARRDLQNLPVDERPFSPRYTRWFGAYTGARYATVLNGFLAAEEVFANSVLTFTCDCAEEDKFAFVRPAIPYVIHLCPVFWQVSLYGRDSQSGTLLHELSHFPAVRGTSDHAYGTANVALLAQLDPDRAVFNADSYEFFAENTPQLAIARDGSVSQAFEELVINESRSGVLARGEQAYFRVKQAGAVELTSLTGDVDLFVHVTDSFNSAICQSRSTASNDSCDLSTIPDAYIEVAAYTDASFQLVATPSTVVTGQGGSGASGGSGGGAFSGWLLLLIIAGWRSTVAARRSPSCT